MRESRPKDRISQPRHAPAILRVCLRCRARERCQRLNAERPCPKIARLKRWTDLAPKARFRADDLATLNGLGLRQLERQFHDLLGRNPQEWLYELLTARVKELLLSGKSLKETAAELGFAYPGNLSRCLNASPELPSHSFWPNKCRPLIAQCRRWIAHRR
jgi:transcriptional regulator GlxA family with amidase domain